MATSNTPNTRPIPGFEKTRGQVLLTLLIYAFATLFCVGLALTPDPAPAFVPPPGATNDLDVFGRIVNRVHSGESFHDASHVELRDHDYPTRSVFNWRTPVYAWWLGSEIGWRFGSVLLGLLVIVTAVSFSRVFVDANGLLAAAIGMVFYVGATAWCFGGETYLFTEVWAGMLIAFSVCAYQREYRTVAVIAGLAALSFRELALPYCLVCAVLAVTSRRKAESASWLAGLTAFVFFMLWHNHQVQIRLTPSDLALPGGWVRFGGLRFVLSTAQTNIFLMGAPLWCTGIYLPFCLLGLYGLPGETGRRIGWTIALYLTAFAVVGNPFNFYWGFLNAPLLALCVASAPEVLSSLISHAFPVRMSDEARLADV